MIQRTRIVGILALVCVPYADAQQLPLDRAEILGRLSLGYSPSYIAQLVKSHGVTFASSADFLSRIKLGGGDGILVERLSSAETASRLGDPGQERPFDQLAKCAELLHIGDGEQAATECPASLDENPESPWPVLAALRALTASGISSEERVALLRQAVARAPNLLISHRALAMADTSPEERAEEAKTVAVLGQWQETGEGGSFGEFAGDVPFAAVAVSSGETPDTIKLPRAETNRTLREHPDSANAHLAAAFEHAALDELPDAQREIEETLRLEPDNIYVHLAIANYDSAQHNLAGELAEYRQAVRIAPFESVPRRQLTQALVRGNRTDEAVSEWLNFLALVPRDIAASHALVSLYLERHDYKSAIAELRRSLKASSLSFLDESKFVTERFNDLTRLGELLKENRELDAAADQYVYLLRFKPDHSGVHNDYASVLFDQHKLDQAIDEYTQALRLDPDNASAHRNIGVCLVRKKNLAGAILEFRLAQELDPEETRTLVLLGSVLAQEGDLNAAIDEFHQAIREDPKSAEAHMAFAQALASMKDTASAIDELELALNLQPDFPAAENELARIYATAEDPGFRNSAQALILAQQAVKTSTQPNAAFLDTLAEALLLNDHRTEALCIAREAARLEPQNDELQARLLHFREAVQTNNAQMPNDLAKPQGASMSEHGLP